MLVEDNWVGDMENIFHECQLDVLSNLYLPIDDDIAYPWSLQQLMATREMIRSLPAHMADEWWEIYRRAADDVHHGASIRMAMVSAVVRKQQE